MNFLFIIPSQKNVYGSTLAPPYPPLGALYLASALEARRHKVHLVDADAEQLDDRAIINRVGDIAPDWVGFSCVTPTINHGLRLAEGIKKKYPHIKIIMGGIHATIDPMYCINNPHVDFVALGEAEHTVCDLLDLPFNSKEWGQIAGIYWKNNGVVQKNPPRELEHNIDTFSFPAFHLIKNIGAYSPPDAVTLPVLPMISSRGCPGTCTFCCTKQIFGRKFRARSVGNILEEIDRLVQVFHVKEIHFVDDVLTTNKKRLLEICDSLAQRNIPVHYAIPNGVRADMVDKEIFGALKKTGVTYMAFGLESGNEEILKVMKKGITKDQMRNALRLAKQAGFETWGFFILGLPGETKKTVNDTIDFAIELNPTYAKFSILKPFPGSEVFDQLSADHLIDVFDYDAYGCYSPAVHHLPLLSNNEILQLQKKAYRRFYVRPKKILQLVTRLQSIAQARIAFRGVVFILARIFLPQKAASINRQ